MDIQKLLDELTVEEKAAIVSGTDFMFTNEVPRLGIPAVAMADGPHGLRKQTGETVFGMAMSTPATSFPTAVTTACGWNEENLTSMGQAIGEECRHYGVNLLLGPGVNIKRNPLCGRNFEYFSEDPLLAGKMGAAMVKGVQSLGVGVATKHFALNNSENYRLMGNSVADERAMREIYLKPFEVVVKEAKPDTLMCAYNAIGGTYCSENDWLLNKILREEWGFQGAVMTDWGATHDRVKGLLSGLDLEMPGDTAYGRKRILDAAADGTLPPEVLDRAVKRILTLAEKYRENEQIPCDFKAHHTLAGEIAQDCAVLLENDGTLPLSGSEKITVIGDLFRKMRYQGSGSSLINATEVTSAADAFEERGISFAYAQGYAENSMSTDEGLIDEAIVAMDSSEVVLIFAGLTDFIETEASDRVNMKLPENQLSLMDSVLDAARQNGQKTVLILYGGSVIELPFAKRFDAILHMFLPGQNGGTATAKLLFGDSNPAGRLAESWPLSYEDVPFGESFGRGRNELYRESIYVGYRYYETVGKRVRYPFGYGLSYTDFEYEDISVTADGETVRVTVTVKNTGKRFGAEVVQLYVSAPKSAVFKPIRELRAFQKVYLAPNEAKKVNLTFQKSELCYYNTKEKRWVLEEGDYTISACSDCQTVRKHISLWISGERVPSPYPQEVAHAYLLPDPAGISDRVFEMLSDRKIPSEPPKKPFTLESPFGDFKNSFIGGILYRAVMSVPNREYKKALRLPPGIERDTRMKGALFLRRVLKSNSILSMSMSAGKMLPYNLAEGIVHLVNGHIFRAIGSMLARIKVPPLPKNQKVKR